MDKPVALLLTDLVGSAALAEHLGDAAMGALWSAHDRLARDLLRHWNGREIDKTDGFLLIFSRAADALAYALAYHRALASLPVPQPAAGGAPPSLRARAGLHVGMVSIRENPAADVAMGAKPLEVDGVSKPLAARVMSTALGGQTLLTVAARDALASEGALPERLVSHGHWRVQGLPVPLELFEVGDDDAPFTPPPDAPKVFRVVRQGEHWLPLRETRHTLPAARDAFVGRRESLQALARRFDEGARLVSLLAIGGCGKTRLATHFGWTWMGEYPGGVWFCDLTAARTLEGLCGAVAQGLELPLGRADPVQQIGHAIGGRGLCLVILDNFEQVARHAEATLGRWLERAAEARFLVTSREVLGIPGEVAVALPPMPQADGEKLFLRRAEATQGFAPGPEDRAAIGPLVQLLDGLPLAIELAVARVRMLSPSALLARMSERFKLLATGGGRHDRQATLRATFDWSWDLLTPPEKAALAQLSVFEGGFDLDAAEAVIDLGPSAADTWTLDVVNSLVDKSFVRPLGNGRFDLLVSVQAYADEHLRTEGRYPGSGPAALAAALARHGAWFAGLGPERVVADGCADLDNLVAACRRAAAAADPACAAGALDGAWAALSRKGPFSSGAALAETVCALPALAGSAAAHAHAVLAEAFTSLGRHREAQTHCETALVHARAAGDRRCEASAMVRIGTLHARAGRPELAREALDDAVRLAQELGDRSLECAARNNLGGVDFEQGRMPGSQAHYEAALGLARLAGDRQSQAKLLGNLGNVFVSFGQLDPAQAHYEEALALILQLGDRPLEGNQLNNLSMLHYLRGELERASTAAESAIRVARDLGHAMLECTVQANLGLIHIASGRLGQAHASCNQALALARRLGDRHTEGQVLGLLGLALAREADFTAARTCLAQGDALLRESGDGPSLGLLACSAAECEWLAGDRQAALAARDQAARLAVQSGSGPRSELGLALASLNRLLAASNAEVPTSVSHPAEGPAG